MNIATIENFAHRDICAKILEFIENSQHPENVNETDPNVIWYRRVCLMEQDAEIYFLVEMLCERLRAIAEERFSVNLDSPMWGIAKTLPGNVPDEHADSQNMDGSPKIGCENFYISAVIYLNNEYAGGELVFPKLDIRYSPSPGDCVLFPSDLSHSHYVDSVGAGKRIAIPIWFPKKEI
jgi:hypothetical protein